MKIDGLANRVSRQLQLQAYLLATSSLYPHRHQSGSGEQLVRVLSCLLVRDTRNNRLPSPSYLSLCIFFSPSSTLRFYDYHRRSTIAIEQPRILLTKRTYIYIYTSSIIDSNRSKRSFVNLDYPSNSKWWETNCCVHKLLRYYFLFFDFFFFSLEDKRRGIEAKTRSVLNRSVLTPPSSPFPIVTSFIYEQFSCTRSSVVGVVTVFETTSVRE